MYISFEEYTALYDRIEEIDFNRLEIEARRIIDRFTSGIDGVKKLNVAFPVDEDDVIAVKHCAARVINVLYQIQEAEKSASVSRGYEENPNGMRGKVVSSVTAGNESISYVVGGANTAVDKAITNIADRNRLISGVIRDYLSGVNDANGVCLLYMGVYPCV